MEEIVEAWKDIAGYEGRYMVSDHGNIKSLDMVKPQRWPGFTYVKKGQILALTPAKIGYYYVTLHKDLGRKKEYIHRLTAEAFIPNPEQKKTVNHKDGNKLNNHVSNLEWHTYSENNKHAVDTGLRIIKYGKDHSSFGKKYLNRAKPKKIIPKVKTPRFTKTELEILYTASTMSDGSDLHHHAPERLARLGETKLHEIWESAMDKLNQKINALNK